MPWTRASQLDRTLQCLGSAYLWNTVPALRLIQKSEHVEKAADYGTMVHHWKATGEIVGSDSHVKTFTKKLDFLEAGGIQRLDVWPGYGYHEVSVAYNCLDGRVALCYEGNAEIFKTQHSEPWITGTMDYYASTADELWIDDLKTGAQFESDPDALAQLYLYAMVMNKILPTGKPVKVSITHWPKYTLDTLPIRTEGWISQELLSKFESKLQKDYRRYKSITELTKEFFRLGDECTFCPAKSLCPIIGDKEE